VVNERTLHLITSYAVPLELDVIPISGIAFRRYRQAK
jgi:hypothetical protein